MQAQTAKNLREFDPTVWVDLHGDYLFAFACSRVRDEMTAEDILQKTLLTAIESYNSLAEKSSERVWLCGILKHKIIDHFRQSSKEVDLNFDEADLSSYQYLFADETWKDHWTEETMPSEWPNTSEQAFEKGDFCAVLGNCLDELPIRIANVFTLHEMDGFEGAEICEILQVSKDSYRVMLHRARTHLRRCLEYDWFRKVNV